MGLCVTVGMLADQLVHDQEGAEWVLEKLELVNEALLSSDLPAHNEPTACEVWSGDMFSEFSLFALFEVAGLHWKDGYIPRDTLLDGLESSTYDELFKAALAAADGPPKPTLWQSLTGKTPAAPETPPFVHLVCHSDIDGFYLPFDFEEVVWPAEFDEETGGIWPVGSVVKLAADLGTICTLLEIPAEMNSDNQELITLLENDETHPDGAMWQAQPIAAHAALILRDACEASLKTGAAIAFG